MPFTPVVFSRTAAVSFSMQSRFSSNASPLPQPRHREVSPAQLVPVPRVRILVSTLLPDVYPGALQPLQTGHFCSVCGTFGLPKSPVTPFRMNTSMTPQKCSFQTTYTISKCFKMNTYKFVIGEGYFSSYPSCPARTIAISRRAAPSKPFKPAEPIAFSALPPSQVHWLRSRKSPNMQRQPVKDSRSWL